jgi:hypothetical protein
MGGPSGDQRVNAGGACRSIQGIAAGGVIGRAVGSSLGGPLGAGTGNIGNASGKAIDNSGNAVAAPPAVATTPP